MATTHTEKNTSKHRKNKSNPMSLLISLIQKHGSRKTDEYLHKQTFKQLLALDSYEEYRDAVFDEWLGIKYSTALNAAIPPKQLTVKELKERIDRAKRRREEERVEIEEMKSKIVLGLLKMMMPNGKTLAECTGAECISFGGWLVRVGEHIGPNKVVGKVLGENDLKRLLVSP